MSYELDYSSQSMFKPLEVLGTTIFHENIETNEFNGK